MAALAAIVLLAAASRPEALLQAEFARQRWLAGAEVHELQAAGHRWRYLQAGAPDRPLLVLVHGFTGSKENWLPLMRELAADYRLLAPDLPGWGESERLPGNDYGPVAQAARLAAFLAALDQRPALLVGHSMGGQIVGLMAVRHPRTFDRLVLMSAAGVRFTDNAFARAVLAGDNPFAVRDRASLDRYLGIVFAEPPWLPWPADRALIARRVRDATFEQAVLDRIGRGPEALQLQDELRAIVAPTLLLWCDGDRVIDPSAMAAFRQGLAASDSVLLPGCGHMPMMEQPRETARALAAFAAAGG